MCKKDVKTAPPPNQDTENEVPSDTIVANGIVIAENVSVRDSNSSSLIIDSIAQSNGEYKFNLTGNPKIAEVGDIIDGSQGGGYIRKVISVTKNKDQVIYQTEQGTMEVVFKEGDFTLSLDLTESSRYKSGKFDMSIDDLVLHHKTKDARFDGELEITANIAQSLNLPEDEILLGGFSKDYNRSHTRGLSLCFCTG